MATNNPKSLTAYSHLGIVAHTPQLLMPVIELFSGLTQFTLITSIRDRLDTMDTILVFLISPYLEEARLLAHIREAAPNKRIILIAGQNDVIHNLNGVADFRPLETSLSQLGYALAEIIRKLSDCILSSPMVHILEATPLIAHQNRRAAYRVVLPTSFQTDVVVYAPERTFRLRIVDLAVTTDTRPAGIRLQEYPERPVFPVPALRPKQELGVAFELKTGVVHAKATVVCVMHEPKKPFILVITCIFANAYDESMLRRLWLQAQ